MGKRIIMWAVIGVSIVAVIIGIIIGILYIFPSASFFGVGTVNARARYTHYSGETIDKIFEQRNIIIEAHNTDIQIHVRKLDQADQGKITVFEDASGLSINSLKRTHLNFLRHIDDNGEVFTRIIVREPRGAVTRRAYIVLNLKRDNIEPGNVLFQPYNFILKTGISNVTFDGDPAAGYFHVNNVTVNATGNITFPERPVESSVANPTPFEMSIGRVMIKSARATVTCRSEIRQEFSADCTSGSFTLGEIGSDTQPASMSITGRHNTVYAQKVWGDVDYDCTFGSLSIRDGCIGALITRTSSASISSFSAASLDAKATLTGTVMLNEVLGNAVADMNMGSVSLGYGALGVFGNVEVNTDHGSVTVIMAEGSSGNCIINSSGVGSITVRFGTDATGNCTINGWDGAISVINSSGLLKITVPPTGKATIAAELRSVRTGSVIEHKGSTMPYDRAGTITVTLLEPLTFNLRIENTREAKSFNFLDNPSGSEIDNDFYQIVDGMVTGSAGGNTDLTLKTSSVIELKKSF